MNLVERQRTFYYKRARNSKSHQSYGVIALSSRLKAESISGLFFQFCVFFFTYAIFSSFTGTLEAYDLIKNDQVSASQTYNMAKFIYTLFSIDQGDFEEADITINKRKIGKVEYVADIKHLQWYLLFKRGKLRIIYKENDFL